MRSDGRQEGGYVQREAASVAELQVESGFENLWSKQNTR